MNQLACPKCHQPLLRKDRSYQCVNHHNYDIAKQGYINLLLNPDKATNNPGDSKESLQARKAYLNQGYYDVILNEVTRYIKEHAQPSMDILDLGCGEGYYTFGMKKQLGDTHNYYGLDISKTAIQMATRYDKSINWIVGNSKNIPINDHSLDVITALFTVVNSDELKRTLKNNGYIIHVTANRNHLIEIKELIYDEVKTKSDEHIRLPFNVLESYDFVHQITIDSHEDAVNLLKMTPHYYHIKKERRHIIDELEQLTVTIDIRLTVYQP
ncbi:MAG: methyltransferase domain-containing protein [Erysipelotrichaceae bacterium]|nr:methyltransferase domain-containing protein [Erysipelotrichaceae bacterium]